MSLSLVILPSRFLWEVAVASWVAKVVAVISFRHFSSLKIDHGRSGLPEDMKTGAYVVPVSSLYWRSSDRSNFAISIAEALLWLRWTGIWYAAFANSLSPPYRFAILQSRLLHDFTVAGFFRGFPAAIFIWFPVAYIKLFFGSYQ